jgi:hypothetical protein
MGYKEDTDVISDPGQGFGYWSVNFVTGCVLSFLEPLVNALINQKI